MAILDRTYTFSGCGALLDDVCTQIAEHRLIRLEGDIVCTTLRARRYLAGNLSMIHDEKKVHVFDMVSRRTVGTLDESFVVGSIYTGAVFITKGQLWRVLDIDEGRITVEPARRVKGELPSWEGEQIPVPYGIAREVGALRRNRRFSAYHTDLEACGFASGFLAEMDKNRSRIATDRMIVIEDSEEAVICNICAGHKANEALGRVISILLSARFGTTVGIEIDAYRVLLSLPPAIRASDVRDILVGLDPEHIGGILQLAMKRTTLFKWKLVQIAKKFGAIDPDADYERLSTYKLTEVFENTVVQKEAYRELFSVYMDVNTAAHLMALVKQGDCAIERSRLSILGVQGLFSSRDQIAPPTPDQAVISTLRRRIDQQEIVLACMNCRKWKSHTVAGRVQDQPSCPKCGARLIAVLKPYEEPLFALASKKEKNSEEKAVEARLMRNANIVLSGGKKAVLALAAKGIGPENASRVLSTLTEGDAFYKEILKAERNYIRTRKFW
jgi:ATP-dependent Lhr-like helicase